MTATNTGSPSVVHQSHTLKFARPVVRPVPKRDMEAMSDTSNGRPWQLDDADWLDKRYRQSGDRTIAQELGVARVTVIRARERLGITSKSVGPRRGQSASTTQDFRGKTSAADDDLAAFLARFAEDQAHRAPATDEALIASCQGWLDAKRNRDQLAIDDALLAIASTATLVRQHRIKLRKAA